MLFSMLILCLNMLADTTHQYTFKNKETPPGTAKDFHVKFSPPPIPPITYSPGNAFPGADANNGVNFYGNGSGIATGSTFYVSVTFAGTNPGKVTEYWWTKDGSSKFISVFNNFNYFNWLV